MYVPPNPSKLLELAACFVLIAFALSCGCSPDRVIPGGPFISLFGDVVPTVLDVAAITLGLLTLRVQRLRFKVVALALILLATVGVALAVGDALLFWITPHARGNWIGP